MRYSGEVRFREFGPPEACARLRAYSRTVLGKAKNMAELGGVAQFAHTETVEGQGVVRAHWNGWMPTIEIYAGVVAEEVETAPLYRLAVLGEDGVAVYEQRGRVFSLLREFAVGGPRSVALSADGRWAAWGRNGAPPEVVNVESGESVPVLTAGVLSGSVALSRTGGVLAAENRREEGDLFPQAMVFRREDGAYSPLPDFPHYSQAEFAGRLSIGLDPAGRRMAFGQQSYRAIDPLPDDALVAGFEVSDTAVVPHPMIPWFEAPFDTNVQQVSVSSDGQYMLVATFAAAPGEATAAVFRYLSGRFRTPLVVNADLVQGARSAAAADSLTFAFGYIGTVGRGVSVHRVVEGSVEAQEVDPLPGPTFVVAGVAVSGLGEYVAAHDRNAGLVFWRREDEEYRQFGPEGIAHAPSLSAATNTLAYSGVIEEEV